MAVLIDAFSVVVRIKTIEKKYPGGVDAYQDLWPGQDFCEDGKITSWVGFRMLAHARDFVEMLENVGFSYTTDGDFNEVAIVEQHEGIILPCNWLEFGHMDFLEIEGSIPVCKLFGCSSMRVGMTKNWFDAYNRGRRCMYMSKEEAEKRMVFLRNENGCDYFEDVLTGQEIYFPRTLIRNADA